MATHPCPNSESRPLLTQPELMNNPGELVPPLEQVVDGLAQAGAGLPQVLVDLPPEPSLKVVHHGTTLALVELEAWFRPVKNNAIRCRISATAGASSSMISGGFGFVLM